MKYLHIFLLFIIFNTANAQNLKIVEGTLIVRVSSDEDLLKILDDNRIIEGQQTGLRPAKLLSPYMGIWLLEFDNSKLQHESVLERLQQHPSCIAAQLNRKLQNRATVPNDPNFNQQWQYINSGAAGGLVDADIDADLAWDITTGGLTALGDTIVVCIIDDGLDLTHSDMQPNRWYNWKEIPNNGIDDDGNGYIDDFFGWDAYDNDDDISGGNFGGGHGTPVAGIVGAKGNNGIGVSGVNWDVKLMIVVGGGDEAQAIAAYNYPLMMRRLYNQTNGQNGAFVVTTNASWGIDGALASTAPLWCAMYDTLGTLGILSAGATTNSNTNVDIQGDLPTHCPSDFLVAVTNTNRSDQKVISAGYGTISVDLGAPGEGAYTAAKPNTYASFGGTSGATPHVAGTIALLYAVPCPLLALRAKTDPQGTALLIKDFLLRGVDSLVGLQNITVSGGRLNAHKSLMLAMQSGCALSGCYQPYGLSVNNLSDSSATLSWFAVPDAAMGYLLQYRESGSILWNTVSTTDTFWNVSGLLPCTIYEWQIAADCDTTIGNYSQRVQFSTNNCCLAPTVIDIDSIGVDLATFSWNTDANVISYEIEYRAAGDSIWISSGISTNNLSLSGLNPCTEYELRIISVCAINVNNSYSQTIRFRTKGCGNCIDLPYCSSAGDDSSYEWIAQVVLNDLTNNSGDNGGYGDFTGFSTDLFRGHAYPLQLQLNTAPFPSANWRWKVWIDYNQDGDFSDSLELVYSAGPITTSVLTASGIVGIPQNIATGSTRMRVALKWGSGDITECGTFSYGEVEDYCVNIMDDPTPNSNFQKQEFSVFPNPSDEILYLMGISNETSYDIINLNGQKVLSGNLNGHENLINVSNLPVGLYIIVMADGKRLKFVKK
jgi:serine protease